MPPVRPRDFLVRYGLPLALVPLAGCAPALRDPGPLPPAPAGPASAGRAEELMRRAGVLFDRRSPDDARRAADLWIEAAGASEGPVRLAALQGAARAGVWLAENETSPEARLDAAEGAVRAAQWCARSDAENPSCAYWLGAAVGLQARERPSTGLSALPEIEKAFLRAAAGDPTLERGGPDRALALLYLRAPGWPTGPGDAAKGLLHARRAVALAPDHPPNQLALAEALEAVGRGPEARGAAGRALELAREALRRGEADAPVWVRRAERSLAGIGEE